MTRIERDIEFIKEIDKMKSIDRMTSLIGLDKRENDAEHSWHISVLAMVVEEYLEEEVDLLKVLKMLLVHDLVEIYAGDTFAYDEEGYKDKLERENLAADRVFGILPKDKGQIFRDYWQEFEDMSTREALFANSVDRLQPILNNFYNGGGTWLKHQVPKEKVVQRLEPIKSVSKELYKYAMDLIDRSVELGYLREEY